MSDRNGWDTTSTPGCLQPSLTNTCRCGARTAPLIGAGPLPRLVRVSVNGYARVGLATVRIRTLDTDGLLPRRVAATGGQVTDAGHLLTWDRKAALFNEPDVAAKWLTHDAASDNFVLLEF